MADEPKSRLGGFVSGTTGFITAIAGLIAAVASIMAVTKTGPFKAPDNTVAVAPANGMAAAVAAPAADMAGPAAMASMSAGGGKTAHSPGASRGSAVSSGSVEVPVETTPINTHHDTGVEVHHETGSTDSDEEPQ